MLTFLEITDFALIDRLEVEFKPGFNVLTGETGAGKTVLIEAIGLLLGDRPDGLAIREGREQASLSCSFDLEAFPEAARSLALAGYLEMGEREVTLSRTLSRKGKSRCTINGRMCNVSALCEVGEALVDIHGQNTHQSLLESSTQIEYLDRFAGEGHLEILQKYQECYERLRSLEKEMKEISLEPGGIDREREILIHEIEEIEGASLSPGELAGLESEANYLRNARKIAQVSKKVRETLAMESGTYPSARDLIAAVKGDINRLASVHESFANLVERLEALIYEIDDISLELERLGGSVDEDPSRLERIEARISLIRDLKRKYGGVSGSLEDVIEYGKKARERLEIIDSRQARSLEISKEIERGRDELVDLAKALTLGRQKAARDLSERVRNELGELGMKNARFEVSVHQRSECHSYSMVTPPGYGPTGADNVEFLFSPARKGELLPFRRIASGGEMSRMMLALKIVLANVDRVPVLIFDEIDAQIGGETALMVGEKLHKVSSYHQVLCVTHMPQLASYADQQYRVWKLEQGGSIVTSINPLDEKERLEEICRMLGDSGGRKPTMMHARDLLARAQARKRELDVR